MTLINGSENIQLEDFQKKGDSLVATFPLYNSCLVIKHIRKKKIIGYWRNYQKKGNYTIPFEASKKKNKVKFKAADASLFEGKWETTIQYGKPTQLIGDFISKNNSLQGTFRSETGDYRYLAGNVVKDSMFLSCFDGTHCYLFTGRIYNSDSISGHFYSGKHYHTTWTATKNPNAKLRHPDSLTYAKNQDIISFNLPCTDGNAYQYSSNKTVKPTIIQLFGSWCPNCVDETKFLNDLQIKYADRINIIGIGFEMGPSEEARMAYATTFKNKMNIQYPILLGGKASKKEASALFPMLNHVMSFPTLLVINSHGEIVKIHTGFNGPATGSYYTDFTDNMIGLLDQLLLLN